MQEQYFCLQYCKPVCLIARGFHMADHLNQYSEVASSNDGKDTYQNMSEYHLNHSSNVASSDNDGDTHAKITCQCTT